MLSAPELYRFTGGSAPTLEQLRRRFEGQVAGSNEPDVTWHNWIIRLLDDGVAVGFVQATVSGGTADIAWLVGVPWQRRGIAIDPRPEPSAYRGTSLQVASASNGRP